MNKVAIRVGEEALPGICAKTGVPTHRVIGQQFARIPPWTLLLIFWGVIPFVIAAGFARRKVVLDVPISEPTQRSLRLVDRLSILGLVAAVGLLVAAVVLRESLLAWAALAVVFGTLIGYAIARRVVWINGRLDDGVVWLYGVHPGFAQEVSRGAGAEEEKTGGTRWGVVALLVFLIAVVLLFLVART